MARYVDYMPLADLQPNPANPKTHDLGTIGRSMDRLGLIDLIAIDERTGLLISGHGRREYLIAESKAGHPPPDGVDVGDDGAWVVPVTRGWASRNDDEAATALVTLNRAVERGGWRNDDLALLLEGISQRDDDLLAVSGYGADDLASLLAVSGHTGNREGSFLDEAASFDDPLSGHDPLTSDADETVSLTVIFPNLEARSAVTSALRRVSQEMGGATTAEALLALVTASADA